jgi:hypothetical protein
MFFFSEKAVKCFLMLPLVIEKLLLFVAACCYLKKIAVCDSGYRGFKSRRPPQ